jgi:hypothetical protein
MGRFRVTQRLLILLAVGSGLLGVSLATQSDTLPSARLRNTEGVILTSSNARETAML